MFHRSNLVNTEKVDSLQKQAATYRTLHPSDKRGERMNTLIDTPAEAFLAVAAITIAADRVGSLAERDVLFERYRTLDAFQTTGPTEFAQRLNDVTERVYDALPVENQAVTPDGIDTLIGEAKAVLSPAQRRAAIRLATELCQAAGICDEERALLERLERGFAGN